MTAAVPEVAAIPVTYAAPVTDVEAPVASMALGIAVGGAPVSKPGEMMPQMVCAAPQARYTVSPEVFAKLAAGGSLTPEELASFTGRSPVSAFAQGTAAVVEAGAATVPAGDLAVPAGDLASLSHEVKGAVPGHSGGQVDGLLPLHAAPMESSLKPLSSEMRVQKVAGQEECSSTTSSKVFFPARAFGAVPAARSKPAEAMNVVAVQVGLAQGHAPEASVHLVVPVTGVRFAGKNNVAEASACGKAKASRVAEHIPWSFGRAAGVAQVAKEAVLACAYAAQEVVSSTRRSIEQEGLRPWHIDTAYNIQDSVGIVVEGAKGRGRAVYDDASGSLLALLQQARDASAKASGCAHAKAEELAAKASEIVPDKSFQMAAASAAGGAVALGVGGAAAGLGAGSAVGAAIGLVPALLTFGLSIPVGAAIGGTAGLCLGAVAGATAGAVGGGAVGFGAYVRKEDIGGMAVRTASKVSDSAEYVKTKAYASAAYMKEQAAVVRTRFVGGSSGGTAEGAVGVKPFFKEAPCGRIL